MTLLPSHWYRRQTLSALETQLFKTRLHVPAASGKNSLTSQRHNERATIMFLEARCFSAPGLTYHLLTTKRRAKRNENWQSTRPIVWYCPTSVRSKEVIRLVIVGVGLQSLFIRDCAELVIWLDIFLAITRLRSCNTTLNRSTCICSLPNGCFSRETFRLVRSLLLHNKVHTGRVVQRDR